MVKFYRDALGLTPIAQSAEFVFFGIAAGYGGHTQVLALFDQSIPSNHPDSSHGQVDVSRSPMHHVAFTIGRDDYAREKERLEQLRFVVRTAEHVWIKWRSLYVRDPDGNVVELVCHDESVGRP